MKKITIIAEAGVNHNGSISIAKKLIKAAKFTGADYVKFQSFKPKELCTYYAKKTSYQFKTTNKNESMLKMLKKYELKAKDFIKLKKFANKTNIKIISTAFDFESAKELNKIGIPIFKTASSDVTNLPLLKLISSFKKPMIISTGRSYLSEVKEAINIIKKQNKRYSILHCVSNYPTDFNDLNLNVINQLKKKFKCEIGFSDHTDGIHASLAAICSGATIIEKHITLNRNMKGPDHSSSLEPNQFKEMVSCIRDIEKAFGNKIKKPAVSEMKGRNTSMKSLVANKNIYKGEIFDIDNISIKRPGTGLKPKFYFKILGKKSKRDIKFDQLIKMSDF